MNNKPKLLYVDDEPINLMLFEVNFRKRYEVITAEDAIQGLQLLDEHKDFKIVISDMRMPKMTGIEFIRKAKKIYPDISFFILTGYDIRGEIQEAINQGLIIKCFQKPLNIDEISESIDQSINKE